MNKKGDIEDFLGFFFFIGLGVLFGLTIYALSSTTVNTLTIKIENGNITESILKESSVSRLTAWGDDHGDGFYGVSILSDKNEILKQAYDTGAGYQTYYIKKFVNCVNIVVFDSDNTSNILDRKEVCKNE